MPRVLLPSPSLYDTHLQIDILRCTTLSVTRNRLPIQCNLKMSLPSTPMVHLKASSIIPICLHPLEFALNRVPNRLCLRSGIALRARGSRVVLPHSAVDVARDHGAAVNIGLAFDVDGEVVGDGDDGERGGSAVADETGGDFDVGAAVERGGDVPGVEQGVARAFMSVDCNNRHMSKENEDLLFLGGTDSERLSSSEQAENVGELKAHCEEVRYSKRGILAVYCNLRGTVVMS